MALKLTLVLLAGIFLAMYFAPAGAPPAPRAPNTVAETPAPAAPAPEPPPTPEPRLAAPVEPPPVIALPRAADPQPAEPAQPDSSAGLAAGSATDPSVRPSDAPLTLPGLSLGGTGGDAAQALSLSDAVRERSEAARAAADTLLQDLAETPPSEPLPEPTSPIPPPQTQTAMVTGSSVNLRAGPSTSNGVVGQVDFGQELVLTGPFIDGWASVVNPETGQQAFMASRFLQIQP